MTAQEARAIATEVADKMAFIWDTEVLLSINTAAQEGEFKYRTALRLSFDLRNQLTADGYKLAKEYEGGAEYTTISW